MLKVEQIQENNDVQETDKEVISQKQIHGYVDWAIQRFSQIVSSEEKNISYDYVLINLSSIIQEHMKNSQHLLGNRKDFIEKISNSFLELLNQLKPQKNIVVSIDGVKPLQKAKYEYGLLLEQDPNLINSSDLYPGAQLIEDLQEKLKQIGNKWIQNKPELNFIILDSNMPGESLYKLRFFVHNQKNRLNFSGDSRFAIVDNSNQGFLTALALHLHHIDLIQRQVSVSGQQQQRVINVGLFKQFIIAEFSLMNVQGIHNAQSIIDDLILISFLLGTETIPKLSFFSFEKNGMDYLYYLYKVNV